MTATGYGIFKYPIGTRFRRIACGRISTQSETALYKTISNNEAMASNDGGISWEPTTVPCPQDKLVIVGSWRRKPFGGLERNL